MLKPVFLILPLLAIILTACTTQEPTPVPTATIIPTATPDIPATVDAQVAAIPTQTPFPTNTPYPTTTPYPTGTPRPTYTLYPTPTPLPTATPYPTNTPFPTATPYPTSTPRPTYTPYPPATPRPTYTPYPTSTPRPTYTPYPTPKPTPTPQATAIPQPRYKWGLEYTPLTISEAYGQEAGKPFIIYACYTGDKSENNTRFAFSANCKIDRDTPMIWVHAFSNRTTLKEGAWYDIAVSYQTRATVCYASNWFGQADQNRIHGECRFGFTKIIPMYRVTGPNNIARRW